MTSRVLSNFASLYEEVGKVYETFFTGNWEDIRLTVEYREFFSAVEEKENLTETRRVYKRFREIMEKSTFVKA